MANLPSQMEPITVIYALSPRYYVLIYATFSLEWANMDFKSDFQEDVLIIFIDQYINSLSRFYDPRWRPIWCIHEIHSIFNRNCDIDRGETRILNIFCFQKKQSVAKRYQLRFRGFFCVSRIYTTLRCGMGLHIGRFDNIYLGVGQDFWTIFANSAPRKYSFRENSKNF